MIIEVDEYKKKVPNYDPEQSELFHRESAHLADKDFIKQLRSQKYSEIIFMAGGAASGKTEFCVSYLMNEHQLVYDGTLKNFDGFKIKLSNIKRYAKNKPDVKVILIMPADWESAFEAFLKRERKMRPFLFFETQIKSKLAIIRILREVDIPVEIYLSSWSSDSNKLDYAKVSFEDGKDFVIDRLKTTIKELYQVVQENNFDINLKGDIL